MTSFRKVVVHGPDRPSRLQLARTMAQNAHGTHRCTTRPRTQISPFPGTPVLSLHLLTTVGDYFLSGDSHFRCSPSGITRRCLLCGQRTLYDVSSHPDPQPQDLQDFLPVDLGQEAHLTTPAGDLQIIRLCAKSGGLATIPRRSIYMHAPFWLLNTQQATICRGWSHVLEASMVSSLRHGLSDFPCGLYGRSRHNSTHPHWTPSEAKARRFLRLVEPLTNVIQALYSSAFPAQFAWLQQSIPQEENVFRISCLCYYNRLTPTGAELTQREANSIHTDLGNLPTLSFVVPLGN